LINTVFVSKGYVFFDVIRFTVTPFRHTIISAVLVRPMLICPWSSRRLRFNIR